MIAQIKNRNYRFIIYMDDLSFEEFEIEYKYLKAVIEGGLERKPDNILLIYATSNRRHLVRETFKDKEDRDEELHTNDTVQEKLSLVYRFGVTIYFGAPDKKAFQNIVRTLAEKYHIDLPEKELLLQANQWELNHGGLSDGRPSSLSDYLCGTEKPAAFRERGIYMQYTLFGAIDIGSSEMELKIFELSRGKGMREIDCIRSRLELGKDTYATGKISTEKLEELCLVLNDFISIMKSYKVDAYRAYTTSAIREAKNRTILLDYLEKKTGLKIEVLDNAEQRFLDYKSIAAQANEFNRIIEKGTAILDVGGGSVQVSLFDKDSLVATQNIRIGNLRIRERVAAMEHMYGHFEELVQEMTRSELQNFKKMYVKDREISNVILVGDYLGGLSKAASLSIEEFQKIYDGVIHAEPSVAANSLICRRRAFL